MRVLIPSSLPQSNPPPYPAATTTKPQPTKPLYLDKLLLCGIITCFLGTPRFCLPEGSYEALAHPCRFHCNAEPRSTSGIRVTCRRTPHPVHPELRGAEQSAILSAPTSHESQVTVSKSFGCHRSEKMPAKSNHCHTSENPLPQVLCLPHLQDPPGGVLCQSR